jgi:hypothetical protein
MKNAEDRGYSRKLHDSKFGVHYSWFFKQCYRMKNFGRRMMNGEFDPLTTCQELWTLNPK